MKFKHFQKIFGLLSSLSADEFKWIYQAVFLGMNELFLRSVIGQMTDFGHKKMTGFS